MNRIFLLSPASTHGRRAQLLFRDAAAFPVATAVRGPEGAPLGDVFAFLSGLYFRGKLAYANAFARPPKGVDGVLIITPSRGLLTPDTPVGLSDLHEFAAVPVDLAEERYRDPLARETMLLARMIGDCQVVLLGSVASDKYVSILTAAFGERLCFPSEFVGRGDMSRGGLLLRCVDDATELTYIPVQGAVRHGARPPKLAKRKA
jgi:hypothetical protein